MEFRILGPVELWSGGERRELRPGKPCAVLAALLLTPRTIVPAEVLIDRLWADPPVKARENLSVYVTRLRASLRQATGATGLLGGRAGGYVLDADPEIVDLHRFRRLCREARTLADSGDREEAVVLFRQADSLWRGDALAGVQGEWAARMRDSLREERRAAIAERVECELDLGRHAELVGEIGGLLAQNPVDERLVSCQMTALYRSGRSGDALSLYRETRRRLVDELGAEPGPALADLHQRILRGDASLSVLPELANQASEPPADGLPPQIAEFTGRAEELSALTQQHSGGPKILLIEGKPGAGKTQLALRAASLLAEQYLASSVYLDLRAHDPTSPPVSPGEALHQLLRALGMPSGQIPHSLADRAARWRAHLSRRRIVVILDDAADEDQVRPLLPTTGLSVVLITSRRRLHGIRHDRVVTLDALSEDDALALFARIAGPASSRDTRFGQAAIDACGRLPLAIQLTAGRIARAGSPLPPSFPPDTAASREQADIADPELMTAFDSSFGALDSGGRRFLRRLSQCPSQQFSAHAAAALTGCTLAETLDSLDDLLNRRLLIRAAADQYRFHDLVRGLVAVRATEEAPAGERHAAVGRLLRYYLRSAGHAVRLLFPSRPAPALAPASGTGPGKPATGKEASAWLESEWRNILSAARYASGNGWQQECADLTHLLAEFMETRGYWDEALSACALALQACGSLGDPVRTARASLDLSLISGQTGRHDTETELAENAAEICRSLHDNRGLADALDQIGLARQRAGLAQEALAHFREARALYDDAGDQLGSAASRGHAGISCWHLGRYQEALNYLQEALTLYRAAGDERGEAKTLNNLGKVLLNSGRDQDALTHFRASLEIFARIDGTQSQAVLLHNIGSVHHRNGYHDEALTAYRRALARYRALGDLPNEANVLIDIAGIYLSIDRSGDAQAHYREAMLISQETGDQSVRLAALRGMAELSRRSGQSGKSLKSYQAALSLARQIADPYEEARILEGMAETALALRDDRDAWVRLRQALDIFEQLGAPEAEPVRLRLDALRRPAERRSLS
jgi:DNA-binding SARP family transcriptional activator/tetratricopeptide (TPR) repeat protein